jgi:hypothetical protein
MYTIPIKTVAEMWRNAVALFWPKTGQAPARVMLEKKDGDWAFRSGGRSVSVKWGGSAPEMIAGTK